MKYSASGNRGPYVSQLALRTMTFSEEDQFFAGFIGAEGQELATKMVDIALTAVTSAIPGTRKEEQLADDLKSADIVLSDEEMTQPDEMSSIAPKYPRWIPPLKRGQDLFTRFEQNRRSEEEEVTI